MQPEDSSVRDIAARASPGISERDETSPSPQRAGQQLVSSNTPSHTVSQTGEAMQIDSPLGSNEDKRAPVEGNPKSISTESLMTPTI